MVRPKKSPPGKGRAGWWLHGPLSALGVGAQQHGHGVVFGFGFDGLLHQVAKLFGHLLFVALNVFDAQGQHRPFFACSHAQAQHKDAFLQIGIGLGGVVDQRGQGVLAAGQCLMGQLVGVLGGLAIAAGLANAGQHLAGHPLGELACLGFAAAQNEGVEAGFVNDD